MDELKLLVKLFKEAIKERTGKEFPTDPVEQLWGAICAVFRSWMNERAILYRKMEGIPDEWGTAVSVMAMVFGNMGESSATGVCFSRDAATGENIFNGEYLVNAQGEDVVAGIRTPQQITKLIYQCRIQRYVRSRYLLRSDRNRRDVHILDGSSISLGRYLQSFFPTFCGHYCCIIR